MGITNKLVGTENTSLGKSVAAFDTVPDPEDHDDDVEQFAAFIRATKVPPRDASQSSPDAVAGSKLFNAIGCSICHTPSISTPSAGTVLNGGARTLPAELGPKIDHPLTAF